MDYGIQETLVCGLYHTICIDENNNIWSFGENGCGQCGHPDFCVNFPKQISILSNINSIACGSLHTICCDYSGNTFSFGNNSYGQLGIGNTIGSKSVRTLISFAFIVQVACGDYSSLCLSDGGEIWGFGQSDQGQLGLPKASKVFTPTKIPDFNQVSFIESRGYFSVCKTYSDEFYVWGSNSKFQLGIGSNLKIVKTPMLCTTWPNNIISVKCSEDHLLLLTNEGEVYTCGNNSYGQLGQNSNIKNIPILIQNLPFIVQIGTSLYTSLLVDSGNNLWVFGYNSYGQLGIETVEHCCQPTKNTNIENVIALSNGGFHTLLKTTEYKIYGMGANKKHQISEIKTNLLTKPIQILQRKENLWTIRRKNSRQKSARK